MADNGGFHHQPGRPQPAGFATGGELSHENRYLRSEL